MLKVNECFGPTIQGEGPSQGKEVLFLRLSFCNLSCSWCDSKYSWDWKNYDKSKEVHEMSQENVVKKLQTLSVDIRALVVSGGEPLLQQKALVLLLQELKRNGWWVEIETNGTVIPNDEFLVLIDQINCSPKLANSGDSKQRRTKPESLIKLVGNSKTFFKFVVGNQTDLEEVWEYVKTYSINPNRVYLMPLGKTKEELVLTTEMVKSLAKDHGFIFSSRLHIELWGMKRGV